MFDDGVKYAALFTFAEGREFGECSLRSSDIRRVGELTAGLHLAADEFQSSDHRYHLDLTYLLDEPMRILEKQLFKRNMGDLSFFKPVAEELRRQITQLPLTPSEYGIIHGDLISTNIYLDQAGDFTIIDFDHCAYGWRAYDLVPSGYANMEVFSLVLEGYESVRPLSDEESKVLPVFIKLREIWRIGDTLNMHSVWKETVSNEDLSNHVKLLRSLV